MLNTFTVDAVLALSRAVVNAKGYIWKESYYRDRAVEYVNNRTYTWIYEHFEKQGVNLSAYEKPNPNPLPNVPTASVKDKKTKFTTADITRLLYATPKYSKWTPAEILPYSSGFNFMDYRGTYERLFSMGVNLTEFAHPDVVMVLASGGVVKDDVKEDLQTSEISFNWDLIGSVVVVLVGLVLFFRIIKNV